MCLCLFKAYSKSVHLFNVNDQNHAFNIVLLAL